MLLIVEKSIRGGICEAIHRYVKTNNKYIKDERLWYKLRNIVFKELVKHWCK